MVEYVGMRGITKRSLKAFSKAMVRSGRLDYVVMATYNDQPKLHFFIFVRNDGRDLSIVYDGFASGYGGEGPHGLVDAIRQIPDSVLVLHLPLSEHEAIELLTKQLTRTEILDLIGSPRILRVFWDQDERLGAYVQLQDNCLYIKDSKKHRFLNRKGPGLAPTIACPH